MLTVFGVLCTVQRAIEDPKGVPEQPWLLKELSGHRKKEVRGKLGRSLTSGENTCNYNLESGFKS